MTQRIVVVISGSGSNLQAIIDACATAPFPGQVVGVLSNKADAFGLTRARNAGIEAVALTPEPGEARADYDRRLAAEVERMQADLVVLAGYMRILSPGFVQQFQGRMVNIHPSLLPRYPGLNTHQRALDNGDQEHGCSVHFVTEELDGGPVILQAKVPVFEDDSESTLAERVHTQEHRIYPLVVKWFCEGRLSMIDNQACLDGTALPLQGYASEE
ncbi:phosphoribosylglycinamide formyltransferase [Ferrimonas sp. SCSIO 43195]|uniref:phosphoribosylglycinamide formyltransferase n=1 Tax=Ferrimonas sp. SCSIO 43195 TaxID=2822844 RepID=UPI002075E77D|nr:phosphoribosylglycinamide formyltransferase [Ferrimonas sp. SCSIO 43195]USD38745.1 phosphoribosylglycinamide formyltransferase [Ferrimonas sp. SCSIO 43195]